MKIILLSDTFYVARIVVDYNGYGIGIIASTRNFNINKKNMHKYTLNLDHFKIQVRILRSALCS